MWSKEGKRVNHWWFMGGQSSMIQLGSVGWPVVQYNEKAHMAQIAEKACTGSNKKVSEHSTTPVYSMLQRVHYSSCLKDLILVLSSIIALQPCKVVMCFERMVKDLIIYSLPDTLDPEHRPLLCQWISYFLSASLQVVWMAQDVLCPTWTTSFTNIIKIADNTVVGRPDH